jgi:hypothetical protein
MSKQRDAIFNYLSSCSVYFESDENTPVSIPDNAIIFALDEFSSCTYNDQFIKGLEDAIEDETGEECAYLDIDLKKLFKLLNELSNF